MKSFMILFLLAIVMVFGNNADILSASPSRGVIFINQKQNAASSQNSNDIYFTRAEDQPDPDDSPDDPKGRGRFFLPPSVRSAKRCNKYPGVCQAPGSPGPDCCKKRCVNVSNDRSNCGMCGRKCRFLEMCCNGGCENLMFNNENCGSCGNKCKGNTKCFLGMCSYG